MNLRKILGIVLVVGLLLVVIYGVMSVMIFNQVTAVLSECMAHPEVVDNTPANFTRQGFDTTPYLVGDFEDVTFSSREDNLTLSGWFIPAEETTETNTERAIIIVHGRNDCKQSPTVLTAAGMLHRNGFNVMVIDLREHGASQIDDGRTTGGLDEYRDVLGAWDWLQQEKGIQPNNIGLMGFSLGAATVTIAAGQEEGMAAVWEDSSFADLNQIVHSELVRNNYSTIFALATSIISRVLTGVDILSSSPVAALSNLDSRPYFIVHSNDDQRIPVTHAHQLTDAVRTNGNSTETWIVSGAGHTETIFLTPDEYEVRLVAFFSKALGQDWFSPGS